MSCCCMCTYLEYFRTECQAFKQPLFFQKKMMEQDKSSTQLLPLTGSVMDSWLSNPGEMSDISGSRGLEGPLYSAAVDSSTAISSSSS